MQKMIILILVGVLVVLGASACSGGNSNPKVKEYSVIQVTGLYDQLSLTARETRALAPGTRLVAADGAAEATCQVVGDIALCHVQVVESGESGWVESLRIVEVK